MTYWAITCKYVAGNSVDVDEMRYQVWRQYSQNVHHRLVYLEMFFERDRTARLHMHALARGNARLFLKKLQLPDYNIDIQKLNTEEDIVKWKAYIRKDQDKQEYMFLD